jgi:hypothetical protein
VNDLVFGNLGEYVSCFPILRCDDLDELRCRQETEVLLRRDAKTKFSAVGAALQLSKESVRDRAFVNGDAKAAMRMRSPRPSEVRQERRGCLGLASDSMMKGDQSMVSVLGRRNCFGKMNRQRKQITSAHRLGLTAVRCLTRRRSSPILHIVGV